MQDAGLAARAPQARNLKRIAEIQIHAMRFKSLV
jgi:hypothetical protein